jgi:hypothetical protein
VKRKVREKQVHDMPEHAGAEQQLSDDLLPLLDRELGLLPDKYRSAIVLCDLQGKSYKEASQQLGCPDGTLAARLTRGRAMLAKRLSRHRAGEKEPKAETPTAEQASTRTVTVADATAAERDTTKPAPTAENILQNGGFEEGDKSPAHWSKGSVSAGLGEIEGVQYIWDKEQGKQGKASL